MKKLLKKGEKTQDIDIKMCKYLKKNTKKTHKKPQREKSFNVMIWKCIIHKTWNITNNG